MEIIPTLLEYSRMLPNWSTPELENSENISIQYLFIFFLSGVLQTFSRLEYSRRGLLQTIVQIKYFSFWIRGRTSSDFFFRFYGSSIFSLNDLKMKETSRNFKFIFLNSCTGYVQAVSALLSMLEPFDQLVRGRIHCPSQMHLP